MLDNSRFDPTPYTVTIDQSNRNYKKDSKQYNHSRIHSTHTPAR